MDFRLAVYAELPSAGGMWNGLPNGMNSTDAANYQGNGLTSTSKIGTYFSDPSSPGVLMTYAELQFILAESVERGFVTGSATTAEAYYTEGVTASYYQYGDEIVERCKNLPDYEIPEAWTIDSCIQDYFVNYADWDPANGLTQIRTERWLALFGQGLEAKFEWNRTNTPLLVPAVDGENNGLIPVRSYYPSDEGGRNPTHLQEAITRQGPDDMNTKVWWDVANNY